MTSKNLKQINQAIWNYYNNLTPNEIVEKAAWSAFATAQFSASSEAPNEDAWPRMDPDNHR